MDNANLSHSSLANGQLFNSSSTKSPSIRKSPVIWFHRWKNSWANTHWSVPSEHRQTIPRVKASEPQWPKLTRWSQSKYTFHPSVSSFKSENKQPGLPARKIGLANEKVQLVPQKCYSEQLFSNALQKSNKRLLNTKGKIFCDFHKAPNVKDISAHQHRDFFITKHNIFWENGNCVNGLLFAVTEYNRSRIT